MQRPRTVRLVEISSFTVDYALALIPPTSGIGRKVAARHGPGDRRHLSYGQKWRTLRHLCLTAASVGASLSGFTQSVV